MSLAYNIQRKLEVGRTSLLNVRQAWKLEELTHAIGRYHWNILRLCEMRWKKNFHEMSTDDGLKVYFSGEEDRHEYGVG